MPEILLRWEKEDNSNVRPFTKAESHFTDARFFEEDDASKETMMSTITSIGRGSIKNVIQVPKEDMPIHQLQKEESQQGAHSFLLSKQIRRSLPP